MKKRIISAVLCALMTTFLFASCSTEKPSDSGSASTQAPDTTSESASNTTSESASNTTSQSAEEVTFIIPIWNPSSETVFNDLGFAEKVKAQIPNLKIQFEVLKETEYESTMKIRNQSGQLPDVFPLQQKWLLDFAPTIAPIDSLSATANNLYASENKIDGSILGLPYSRFGEVVYYRKSVFDEYNLKAPKTWAEFIETCNTIKTGGKYIPFIMGAKDSWTDYPLNEFMPSIVAKNGDYYSEMAKVDNPFTQGQPFYDSYKMIQEFYDAKVMGDDPLGISFDQSKAMFAAKQGAMIAAGDWLVTDLNSALNNDLSDVSTFILPVRNNASDELVTAGSVEEFWCINKNSKHKAEAEALLNFMFDSKLWYSDHINKLNLGPTVKDVTLANPPEVFKEAYATENLKYIIYKAGDADFMKIRDQIKFDVKELGVQMIVDPDLDGKMTKLNQDWQEARKQLGIK